MAPTYEAIASTTLGSDTATVEFTSIPGTFTDLRLVLSVRSDHTSTDYAGLVLNNDTGTNYSETFLSGDGSSAASGRYTTGSGLNSLFSTNLDIEVTAGTWSLHVVDLMSYSNANVFKTGLAQSVMPGLAVRRHVSLWQSTSAVTSIKAVLYTANKKFKSGSTFSLYGIKAAA